MKKPLLAFSLLTIFLHACKDEGVINNPDLASTQSTENHLFAEQTFNDVGRIIEGAFSANGINKSYPTYTIIDNDTLNADTLIINFGPDNTINTPFPTPDGKLRRGKINITYTGDTHGTA